MGNNLSVINNTENSANNRSYDSPQQSNFEKNLQSRANYLKDNRWNKITTNLPTSQNRNKQSQRNVSDWEKMVETSENNYINLMDNPFSHQVLFYLILALKK